MLLRHLLLLQWRKGEVKNVSADTICRAAGEHCSAVHAVLVLQGNMQTRFPAHVICMYVVCTNIAIQRCEYSFTSFVILGIVFE